MKGISKYHLQKMKLQVSKELETLGVSKLGKTENANNSNLLNGYPSSEQGNTNSIARRDSYGNITSNLFRTTYHNDVWIDPNSEINFRVNASTNNYIRSATPTAFKNWLKNHNALFADSYSKNATGYIKLSNGLILQWGNINRASGGNAIFPLVFPNYIFTAIATARSGAIKVSSLNNAYFTWHDIGFGESQGVRFFAVGC